MRRMTSIWKTTSRARGPGRATTPTHSIRFSIDWNFGAQLLSPCKQELARSLVALHEVVFGVADVPAMAIDAFVCVYCIAGFPVHCRTRFDRAVLVGVPDLSGARHLFLEAAPLFKQLARIAEHRDDLSVSHAVVFPIAQYDYDSRLLLSRQQPQ